MDVLDEARRIADLTMTVKTSLVVEHYHELREENERPLDYPDVDSLEIHCPKL